MNSLLRSSNGVRIVQQLNLTQIGKIKSQIDGLRVCVKTMFIQQSQTINQISVSVASLSKIATKPTTKQEYLAKQIAQKCQMISDIQNSHLNNSFQDIKLNLNQSQLLTSYSALSKCVNFSSQLLNLSQPNLDLHQQGKNIVKNEFLYQLTSDLKSSINQFDFKTISQPLFDFAPVFDNAIIQQQQALNKLIQQSNNYKQQCKAENELRKQLEVENEQLKNEISQLRAQVNNNFTVQNQQNVNASVQLQNENLKNKIVLTQFVKQSEQKINNSINYLDDKVYNLNQQLSTALFNQNKQFTSFGEIIKKKTFTAMNEMFADQVLVMQNAMNRINGVENVIAELSAKTERVQFQLNNFTLLNQLSKNNESFGAKLKNTFNIIHTSNQSIYQQMNNIKNYFNTNTLEMMDKVEKLTLTVSKLEEKVQILPQMISNKDNAYKAQFLTINKIVETFRDNSGQNELEAQLSRIQTLNEQIVRLEEKAQQLPAVMKKKEEAQKNQLSAIATQLQSTSGTNELELQLERITGIAAKMDQVEKKLESIPKALSKQKSDILEQVQAFSREAAQNSTGAGLERIEATTLKLQQIEAKVLSLQKAGSAGKSSLGAIALAVAAFSDNSGQNELEAQLSRIQTLNEQIVRLEEKAQQLPVALKKKEEAQKSQLSAIATQVQNTSNSNELELQLERITGIAAKMDQVEKKLESIPKALSKQKSDILEQVQAFSREAAQNSTGAGLERIEATTLKLQQIEAKVLSLQKAGSAGKSSLGAIALAVAAFRENSGQHELEAQLTRIQTLNEQIARLEVKAQQLPVVLKKKEEAQKSQLSAIANQLQSTSGTNELELQLERITGIAAKIDQVEKKLESIPKALSKQKSDILEQVQAFSREAAQNTTGAGLERIEATTLKLQQIEAKVLSLQKAGSAGKSSLGAIALAVAAFSDNSGQNELEAQLTRIQTLNEQIVRLEEKAQQLPVALKKKEEAQKSQLSAIANQLQSTSGTNELELQLERITGIAAKIDQVEKKLESIPKALSKQKSDILEQVQAFSREAAQNTTGAGLERIEATTLKLQQIEAKVLSLQKAGSAGKSSLGAIALAVAAFSDNSGQNELEAQLTRIQTLNEQIVRLEEKAQQLPVALKKKEEAQKSQLSAIATQVQNTSNSNELELQLERITGIAAKMDQVEKKLESIPKALSKQKSDILEQVQAFSREAAQNSTGAGLERIEATTLKLQQIEAKVLSLQKAGSAGKSSLGAIALAVAAFSENSGQNELEAQLTRIQTLNEQIVRLEEKAQQLPAVLKKKEEAQKSQLSAIATQVQSTSGSNELELQLERITGIAAKIEEVEKKLESIPKALSKQKSDILEQVQAFSREAAQNTAGAGLERIEATTLKLQQIEAKVLSLQKAGSAGKSSLGAIALAVAAFSDNSGQNELEAQLSRIQTLNEQIVRLEEKAQQLPVALKKKEEAQKSQLSAIATQVQSTSNSNELELQLERITGIATKMDQVEKKLESIPKALSKQKSDILEQVQAFSREAAQNSTGAGLERIEATALKLQQIEAKVLSLQKAGSAGKSSLGAIALAVAAFSENSGQNELEAQLTRIQTLNEQIARLEEKAQQLPVVLKKKEEAQKSQLSAIATQVQNTSNSNELELQLERITGIATKMDQVEKKLESIPKALSKQKSDILEQVQAFSREAAQNSTGAGLERIEATALKLQQIEAKVLSLQKAGSAGKSSLGAIALAVAAFSDNSGQNELEAQLSRIQTLNEQIVRLEEKAQRLPAVMKKKEEAQKNQLSAIATQVQSTSNSNELELQLERITGIAAKMDQVEKKLESIPKALSKQKSDILEQVQAFSREAAQNSTGAGLERIEATALKLQQIEAKVLSLQKAGSAGKSSLGAIALAVAAFRENSGQNELEAQLSRIQTLNEQIVRLEEKAQQLPVVLKKKEEAQKSQLSDIATQVQSTSNSNELELQLERITGIAAKMDQVEKKLESIPKALSKQKSDILEQVQAFSREAAQNTAGAGLERIEATTLKLQQIEAKVLSLQKAGSAGKSSLGAIALAVAAFSDNSGQNELEAQLTRIQTLNEQIVRLEEKAQQLPVVLKKKEEAQKSQLSDIATQVQSTSNSNELELQLERITGIAAKMDQVEKKLESIPKALSKQKSDILEQVQAFSRETAQNTTGAGLERIEATTLKLQQIEAKVLSLQKAGSAGKSSLGAIALAVAAFSENSGQNELEAQLSRIQTLNEQIVRLEEKAQRLPAVLKKKEEAQKNQLSAIATQVQSTSGTNELELQLERITGIAAKIDEVEKKLESIPKALSKQKSDILEQVQAFSREAAQNTTGAGLERIEATTLKLQQIEAKVLSLQKAGSAGKSSLGAIALAVAAFRENSGQNELEAQLSRIQTLNEQIVRLEEKAQQLPAVLKKMQEAQKSQLSTIATQLQSTSGTNELELQLERITGIAAKMDQVEKKLESIPKALSKQKSDILEQVQAFSRETAQNTTGAGLERIEATTLKLQQIEAKVLSLQKAGSAGKSSLGAIALAVAAFSENSGQNELEAQLSRIQTLNEQIVRLEEKAQRLPAVLKKKEEAQKSQLSAIATQVQSTSGSNELELQLERITGIAAKMDQVEKKLESIPKALSKQKSDIIEQVQAFSREAAQNTTGAGLERIEATTLKLQQIEAKVLSLQKAGSAGKSSLGAIALAVAAFSDNSGQNELEAQLSRIQTLNEQIVRLEEKAQQLPVALKKKEEAQKSQLSAIANQVQSTSNSNELELQLERITGIAAKIDQVEKKLESIPKALSKQKSDILEQVQAFSREAAQNTTGAGLERIEATTLKLQQIEAKVLSLQKAGSAGKSSLGAIALAVAAFSDNSGQNELEAQLSRIQTLNEQIVRLEEKAQQLPVALKKKEEAQKSQLSDIATQVQSTSNSNELELQLERITGIAAKMDQVEKKLESIPKALSKQKSDILEQVQAFSRETAQNTTGAGLERIEATTLKLQQIEAKVLSLQKAGSAGKSSLGAIALAVAAFSDNSGQNELEAQLSRIQTLNEQIVRLEEKAQQLPVALKKKEEAQKSQLSDIATQVQSTSGSNELELQLERITGIAAKIDQVEKKLESIPKALSKQKSDILEQVQAFSREAAQNTTGAGLERIEATTLKLQQIEAKVLSLQKAGSAGKSSLGAIALAVAAFSDNSGQNELEAQLTRIQTLNEQIVRLEEKAQQLPVVLKKKEEAQKSQLSDIATQVQSTSGSNELELQLERITGIAAKIDQVEKKLESIPKALSKQKSDILEQVQAFSREATQNTAGAGLERIEATALKLQQIEAKVLSLQKAGSAGKSSLGAIALAVAAFSDNSGQNELEAQLSRIQTLNEQIVRLEEKAQQLPVVLKKKEEAQKSQLSDIATQVQSTSGSNELELQLERITGIATKMDQVEKKLESIPKALSKQKSDILEQVQAFSREATQNTAGAGLERIEATALKLQQIEAKVLSLQKAGSAGKSSLGAIALAVAAFRENSGQNELEAQLTRIQTLNEQIARLEEKAQQLPAVLKKKEEAQKSQLSAIATQVQSTSGTNELELQLERITGIAAKIDQVEKKLESIPKALSKQKSDILEQVQAFSREAAQNTAGAGLERIEATTLKLQQIEAKVLSLQKAGSAGKSSLGAIALAVAAFRENSGQNELEAQLTRIQTLNEQIVRLEEKAQQLPAVLKKKEEAQKSQLSAIATQVQSTSGTNELELQLERITGIAAKIEEVEKKLESIPKALSKQKSDILEQVQAFSREAAQNTTGAGLERIEATTLKLQQIEAKVLSLQKAGSAGKTSLGAGISQQDSSIKNKQYHNLIIQLENQVSEHIKLLEQSSYNKFKKVGQQIIDLEVSLQQVIYYTNVRQIQDVHLLQESLQDYNEISNCKFLELNKSLNIIEELEFKIHSIQNIIERKYSNFNAIYTFEQLKTSQIQILKELKNGKYIKQQDIDQMPKLRAMAGRILEDIAISKICTQFNIQRDKYKEILETRWQQYESYVFNYLAEQYAKSDLNLFKDFVRSQSNVIGTTRFFESDLSYYPIGLVLLFINAMLIIQGFTYQPAVEVDKKVVVMPGMTNGTSKIQQLQIDKSEIQ
ncbi:kinesin_K39 [Hexamita inflata]|uniref:Putative n=2 Tax=Hexamita inflata TaxID=28002 RepID=A0ABP1GGR7_9EUKA